VLNIMFDSSTWFIKGTEPCSPFGWIEQALSVMVVLLFLFSLFLSGRLQPTYCLLVTP
jgi:hypothetical protein